MKLNVYFSSLSNYSSFLRRLGLFTVLILLGVAGFANCPTRTLRVDGVPITLLSRSSPNLKPLGTFETLTIPIRKVGNLLLIEAQVDDLKGNFILDLGAPYLVLNSTYFRDYEIDNQYTAGTLNSSTDYVRRANVKNFDLLGLSYRNLSADVTDLANIENKRHVKILGLLGVNLFKQFIFDLNLEGKQLILHRKMESVDIKTDLWFSSPIRNYGDHLVILGEMNEKKLRFGLDTGAEMNILDNKISGKVFENMEILRSITVSGANGSSSEVLITRMKGLTIAGVELAEMRTLVGSLYSMGKAYGTTLDGMLGYPFFVQGRSVINFKKRTFQFYKTEGEP